MSEFVFLLLGVLGVRMGEGRGGKEEGAGVREVMLLFLIYI